MATKTEQILNDFFDRAENMEQIREIQTGIFHLGEDQVAELLEEAGRQNKKLVFYNEETENSDKLLYKFE